ncbi:unnamed protein product [Ixodes hexagonus]
MFWTRCPTASLFVLLCLCPRAWLLACHSLFSPISGDMPKDFSLKVGDPLVLNCTLTVSKFTLPSLFGGNTTYEVNGSHLALKFNDSYVPQDWLVYGSSSILFRKDSAEYSDTGTYYCNLRVPDRTLHVCATLVTVGEKPLQVEDFKCISYLYRNLTCSWRIPEANVKSNYTLGEMFGPLGSHKGFPRECPATKELRTPSSCTWNLSSSPAYRKEASRFHFILTGRNALGSRNWSYTYDHLEILKISEPTEFRRSAVTEHSITVGWMPPVEQSENRKLQVSYEIGYLSQYEDEWKVRIIVVLMSESVEEIQNMSGWGPVLFALIDILRSSTDKTVPQCLAVINSSKHLSRKALSLQEYLPELVRVKQLTSTRLREWSEGSMEWRRQQNAEGFGVGRLARPSAAGNVGRRFSTFSRWLTQSEGWLLGGPVVFSSGFITKKGRYSWKLAHRSLHGRRSTKPQTPQTPADIERAWYRRTDESNARAGRNHSGTVYVEKRKKSRESQQRQNAKVSLYGITGRRQFCKKCCVYSHSFPQPHGNKSSWGVQFRACNISFVTKKLEKITQVSLERDGPHSLLMRWQLECSALKSFVDSYQIETCEVVDKYRKMALHDAAGCQYSKYDPQSCTVYNVTNADAEELLLDGLEMNSVYRSVVRAFSNGRLTDDSPAQCARTESVGPAISLVVGVAVGGALGLTILVLVLYLLARWMKKKVDMIKEIKIQLPDGLDSASANQMHSYKNMRNGTAHRGTEANPSPHIPYGRMGCFSAADHAPKKRHDSGHSQGSSSSTDELLYKTRRADTLGRNPSGDSSGGSTNGHESLVSASTARTSSLCDSGAESDPAAPPSPDCVLLPHNTTPLSRCRPNLPKLDEDKDRESQDSGLDTAADVTTAATTTTPAATPAAATGGLTRDGPLQQPYSKLAICMDAETAGLQSQLLASSEPSLFDIPGGGTPQHARTSAPYSKFGLARSSDDMLPGPYSVCRSPPPGARRREGPPAMPYSQLALRRGLGNAPPVYGAGVGDVTVGMMLEQPRVLPHIKDVSVPVRAMPPSGYVTVGQAMKVQPPPVESPASAPGYSKLGMQPAALLPTRPVTDSGYVPLHHMVGVSNGCAPYVPLCEENKATYNDGESSSDDVAIGGGENSNNASLDDFSFSSASPTNGLADCLLLEERQQFPYQTHSPVHSVPAAPSLGYVSAAAVSKCPFDELAGVNDERTPTNGYAPVPPATRGPQPADDYVSHNAAIDWGRSASGDSVNGSADDGSPLPSDGTTNGYVSLPTAMDVAGPRNAAVSYVPGVKTGSSASRVDCSV